MSRWILPLSALTVSILGTIVAHRAVETETFRIAGELPDIVHVRILSVGRPGEERAADVVQTLKGGVAPGRRLRITCCCDWDPRVGEEFVLMTDVSARRIWVCFQDGQHAVRPCKEGYVVWDDLYSREVPLWFWKRFLPSRTVPRPPLVGG